MSEYNVIVSLSGKYKGIADTFFQLWNKNSSHLPSKIFISADEDFDVPVAYDGKVVSADSLPRRIKRIAETNPADYYICLLGDAFICSAIDPETIETLFRQLRDSGARYCNLRTRARKKNSPSLIRRIRCRERYSTSFIAFIASYGFIQDEFDIDNDCEFEKKYLKLGLETKQKTFDEMFVVNDDFFHIQHGISNGKWVKSAKKKVLANGVSVDESIPTQSFADRLRRRIAITANVLLPLRVRYGLKKVLRKMGFRFKTEY